MSQTPSPPRGTRDLLPPLSEELAALETAAASLFGHAGYRRIVTPMFESTDIFVRGVGTSTDIVSKEMYTFEDRSGNSLTLRPEGTAPVMRAIVTHHMWDDGLPIKLWYAAPMFRYERPQKGRYRQHFQLGIEAVGSEDPALDAEVIRLGHALLSGAGVGEISLLLNSMGHPECRAAYMPALVEYLQRYRDQLDADCKRRMETNPLRVFDCKVPEDQEILAGAPTLADFLCDDCRAHLASVQELLDGWAIKYEMAPRLVRGFDYYTRTTFEYQSSALDAAQNALGGGGRYDGLVEQLGGPALPGIGFGLGADRILHAREAAGSAVAAQTIDCLVVPVAPSERAAAIELVWTLRDEGLGADLSFGDRSLKSALKFADKIGARFAGIIGTSERQAGTVTMRDMTTGDQAAVPVRRIGAWLREQK